MQAVLNFCCIFKIDLDLEAQIDATASEFKGDILRNLTQDNRIRDYLLKEEGQFLRRLLPCITRSTDSRRQDIVIDIVRNCAIDVGNGGSRVN